MYCYHHDNGLPSSLTQLICIRQPALGVAPTLGSWAEHLEGWGLDDPGMELGVMIGSNALICNDNGEYN